MQATSFPLAPVARRLAGTAVVIALCASPFAARAQSTSPEGPPSVPDQANQPGTQPGVPPDNMGTTSPAGTTTPPGSGVTNGTTSGTMDGSAGSSTPGSSGTSGSAGTAGSGTGMSGPWGGGDGFSLIPWTRRGYVGLNVGQPDYKLDACGTGFSCDDPDARMRLYTGGLLNEWLGAEVAYVNEGKADRGGGNTKAEGLNLSLVVRAPLGQFNVFGKVGATYGRTRVSANALSLLPTGTEKGWGRSYGAGVGFDFTPAMGVVLEWERNRYRFVGDVRDDVDSANLGLVLRF